MPKLSNQAIRAKGADGTTYSQDVAASVSSDGNFRVAVPDELRDVICTAPNKPRMMNRSWSIYEHGSGFGTAKRPWSIEAKRLDICLATLHAAAEEFLACEVKRERVICYSVELEVAFWTMPDGEITPCGHNCRAPGGAWYKIKSREKSYSANERIEDTYKIGLAAEVWDKVSHVRPSGTKVIWEPVSAEDRFAPASPLAKLQSFCCLSLSPGTKAVKEMPYSDAASLWFHDCMISLFKMARGMDEFFSNQDNLLAIQEGRPTLLSLTAHSADNDDPKSAEE